MGHHVVFGDREFSPGTPRGRELLAHELAHVTQAEGNSILRRDRREGTGSVTKTYQCTGITLAGRRLVFLGNEGPAVVVAAPIDIPPGTYKATRDPDDFTKLRIVATDETWGKKPSYALGFTWKMSGDQKKIDAFKEKVDGYLQSLGSPVDMRVSNTRTNPKKTRVIDEEEVETGEGERVLQMKEPKVKEAVEKRTRGNKEERKVARAKSQQSLRVAKEVLINKGEPSKTKTMKRNSRRF